MELQGAVSHLLWVLVSESGHLKEQQLTHLSSPLPPALIQSQIKRVGGSNFFFLFCSFCLLLVVAGN